MTLAELAGFVPTLRNNAPTHWWQGASGRWYVHTIYPMHAIPGFTACNYIFARPRFDGTREPFYIGQSGAFYERLDRHETLGPALWLGATEVHVHLLAQSPQERLDTETDLRHAHVTPLNGQPAPTTSFLPPPVPASSLISLADSSFLATSPSSPLQTLADLFPLEASSKGRSRSSWNDRLTHWERPASETEEHQIARAAAMVRAVLARNTRLHDEGVRIAPQGSYHNNTNVRLEADMDLRAVHPAVRLENAYGIDIHTAQMVLGLYDTGRTYSDIMQEMHGEIVSELRKRFGASNIDVTGNKAIRLKKHSGSRADVDIVPAFTLYWVMWHASAIQYRVEEGVAILGKDGRWTYNFPEQHHTNGIAKRTRTRYRFKRHVRILRTDQLITVACCGMAR